MTATTEGRNTKRRNGDQLSFPAAVALVLVGTIVVLDATGHAKGGSTATGLVAVGVAEDTVDNTAGAAGDLQVPVRRGTFAFANSTSADAIANTDYGSTCYVVDNQTVAKTDGGGTRSAAGIVRGVDSNGVWVEF